MEDALTEELALFFKALLFLFMRISLLVRADFPSLVPNSILVLELVFFFYRLQATWAWFMPWLLFVIDELAVKSRFFAPV